jgi:plastocyanin
MNDDRTHARKIRRFHSPERSGRGSYILAIALAGMALTLAACSSSGSASSSTASTGAASTVAPASGGITSPSIIIHNFMFSPATVTVTPGATVTVTNKDQVTHTLTATKGEFSTGDIAGGQSKTFTAPKAPGRYTYICSIHQYMTGTIVVSG